MKRSASSNPSEAGSGRAAPKPPGRPKNRASWKEPDAAEIPGSAPAPESEKDPGVEREKLLAWFEAEARALPWRVPPAGPASAKGPYPPPRRDPYRTWISEVMLQQTQVSTVIAYFERWMKRFPTLEALAGAAEEDVLRLWAGLGYYSRARNLHATALRVVRDHGGGFPQARKELLALPGIGAYTAGAILSLAFDLPEPLLDGNLVRVFSRLYGMDFLPDSREHQAAYWDRAHRWARGEKPGSANEALMELGALICLPKSPLCPRCPVRENCSARLTGRVSELPPPRPRPTELRFRGRVWVIRRGREVLLQKPPPGALLAGLWIFPVEGGGAGEKGDPEGPDDPLAGTPLGRREAPETGAWRIRKGLGTVSHGITRHRLEFSLCLAEAPAGFSGAPPLRKEEEPGAASGLDALFRTHASEYRWVPEAEVESRLVSGFPRKVLRLLEREGFGAS